MLQQFSNYAHEHTEKQQHSAVSQKMHLLGQLFLDCGLFTYSRGGGSCVCSNLCCLRFWLSQKRACVELVQVNSDWTGGGGTFPSDRNLFCSIQNQSKMAPWTPIRDFQLLANESAHCTLGLRQPRLLLCGWCFFWGSIKVDHKVGKGLLNAPPVDS